MYINLSDKVVSAFLSGFFVVLVLIAVGGFLAFVLQGMRKSFPFTRLALVLTLAPMSLVKFFEYNHSSMLYLYAFIAVLLGITIDGINHLLLTKEQPKSQLEAKKQVRAEAEPKPGVIVWEKAE